jgi:uncharacterized protein YcaQ
MPSPGPVQADHLARAIQKLGFVQATRSAPRHGPRTLTLRHRVDGLSSGDLEAALSAPRRRRGLPRQLRFCRAATWRSCTAHAAQAVGRDDARQAQTLLAFIRERGPTHPRLVQAAFAHGRITNYWGGSGLATRSCSTACTNRGLLRVARRENGIRIYEAVEHPAARRCRRPHPPRRRVVDV